MDRTPGDGVCENLFFIVAWCLLCVVCWPLAVVAVILWPLVWLLALPFRLVSIAVEAMLALIKALVFLPARLLERIDRSAACGERAMISAREGLELLRDGNRRFVADVRSHDTLPSRARRIELAAGQEPFAAVLGCSDSRVPVEIVFDQGLGDLFVIRVAGNIVAPSQVGSVEFAAEQFGTRLVVVSATPIAAPSPRPWLSCSVPRKINRGICIPSSIWCGRRWKDCWRPICAMTWDELVHQAVRANIRASVNHLRHGSEIIEHLVLNDGLLVVGAEYSLKTGVVDFSTGFPATRPDDARLAADMSVLPDVSGAGPRHRFLRHGRWRRLCRQRRLLCGPRATHSGRPCSTSA